MDPKLIKRLARIMSGEGLTELHVEEEGLTLTLKRGEAAAPQAAAPVLQVLGGGLPAAAPGTLPAVGAPAEAASAAGAGGLPPGVQVIESPMVGTFYRSPSPDSDSFVEVGGKVDDETVVCIIEAMKVMNEIKAELRGTIQEVLVSDGEPVEFGQPLFLVAKG
jgi:acetyl-CoA carboxylase biotin carboxyl carrier protein